MRVRNWKITLGVYWGHFRSTLKLLEGIQNFPSPKNITDIRSFFGLVNQVNYAFAQAPVMAPFRDLLKHAVEYLNQSIVIEKMDRTSAVLPAKHGISYQNQFEI